MAQPVYESSPSSSHKFNRSILEYATQVPDKSNKINSLPHVMSSRGNGTKRKMSRLELMKIDFRQKLMKEKEDKLHKHHVAINRDPKKSKSGGAVREFFAERRALEAQQNPSSLPPIQAHFYSVKGKRNQAVPPQRQEHFTGAFHRSISQHFRSISQQQELAEDTANSTQRRQSNHSYQQSKVPAEIMTTGKLGSARRINNNYYRNIYQKRTKGVDKQDPLPPLHKGTKKQSNKPPTPNKRYEHFADLSKEDEESDETHTHMPTPPREAKPLSKRPKAPLRPVSNEMSEDESSSVCTDDVPPNLRRLKAKALLQKQLSQQKVNTGSQRGKAKLSDFQKWQIEQDEARQDRLDRFRNKTPGTNASDAEHGNTKSSDLAKKELELLEKIKHEQARLERLQNERQRLEEQEKREEEEEEEWTLKFSEAAMTNNDEEERAPKPAAPRNKPVHSKQKKSEVRTDDVNMEEEIPTETDEQPDESFKNFYAEAAAQAEQHQDQHIMPCSVCGRSFASDRLTRHEKVCAKNSKSQRKTFDARMQRAMGTGLEVYIRRGKYKEEPEKKAKKVDWRIQHKNFIRTIRYAKGASDEPPPPTENPEYVQCPHCKRKFNPYTAERHIPKCKDIKSRPAPPKKK